MTRFNLAEHCIANNARLRGGKRALTVVGEGFSEEAWTFAAFDDAVRRVAGGLGAAGFAPGERILIRMANDSDYALVFFGAIAAGLVPIPSSTQLTGEEASFLLRDSGAAVMALSADLAVQDVPSEVRVLTSADVAGLKKTSPVSEYHASAAEDPAFLIYTSGTTGRPKGVLHAQRVVLGRQPMHDDWLGLRDSDIMLHAGAFNWTYTLGVGMMDPWVRGASVVLYNGARDHCIWPALVQRYSATLFAAVPSVYRQILKYCDLSAFDLASLRHGLTAGEALSPALLTAWQEATGKNLYEALGMSEISTYISTSPDMQIKPGSPGRPQSGRRVSILPVQPSDRAVPTGEVGLVAVHRSDPGLMLGYWNRPDEEAEVFRGDWFLGGDLAAVDGDGYFWYHGRNDDVMNAFGYRVSPLEVELVLAGHAAVAEVAVTELRVAQGVSVIAAFVVPRDPDEIDAAALHAHARQHLAAYKCPREIIFVDHLPRTANGKVVRRQLRELVHSA